MGMGVYRLHGAIPMHMHAWYDLAGSHMLSLMLKCYHGSVAPLKRDQVCVHEHWMVTGGMHMHGDGCLQLA